MHTRKIFFCTYIFTLMYMGDAYSSPDCIQLTNHTWKTLINRPCHNILGKRKDKEPIMKFFLQWPSSAKNRHFQECKKANLFVCFLVYLLLCLSAFLNILLFLIHIFGNWSVHDQKSGPCSAQSRNFLICYSEYLEILMNML